MKITYKCDYALKTLLELALNYEKQLVTIPDLSKRLDIPRKFLEQVLLDLKRGGFADSKRGKEGGYYLAKTPAQITLGAVIRYIEGPIEPIACVDDCYKDCKEIRSCTFRPWFQKTAEAISSVVDHVTFETLVNDMKKNREAIHYDI